MGYVPKNEQISPHRKKVHRTQARLEDANIEEKEGTSNRIKAMKSLHAQDIGRLIDQLRNLSKKLAGEKKISNTVSAGIILNYFLTIT